MTEKEAQPKNDEGKSEEFPVAAVRPAADAGRFLQSRMWWLTLICLLLASWMTWSSLPEKGTEMMLAPRN